MVKVGQLDNSFITKFAPAMLFLLASLVFIALAIERNRHQHIDEPGIVLSNVSPQLLLGGRSQLQGAPAPYTLIEFGDFQCPPCRHAEQTVEADLKQYQGKVQFDFRELPLVQIHPDAEAAAIVAESARSSGRFWPIHDRLYSTDISNLNAIHRIINDARIRVNMPAALKQIHLDNLIEHRLSINSTPTFLLCLPNGSVIRLDDINALQRYVH